MLQRIDSFYLDLAKKIIIVFNFFGASRKTAMIAWIIFAGISCAFATQFDNRGHFQFNIFLFLFWTLFILPANLSTALMSYREDDVLPNTNLCQNTNFRLAFNLLNPILAVLGVILGGLAFKTIIWANLLWIPCIFFYAYFLLNQGSRSKYTLKGIVRFLARKIKTALRPAPRQEPLPQPSPA